MSTIDPGDDTAAPGTMAGAIYAILESSIGAPLIESSQIGPGLKRLAASIAQGIVDNITSTLADGEFLRVLSGDLGGGPPNGGTPSAHASTHANDGADELDVTGLSGLLADAQLPLAHASSHANGQGDALDVTTLAGFPGGSSTFLRADGTFAAPAAGGMQPILLPASAVYLQTGLLAASLSETAGEKPIVVYPPSGGTYYATWFAQLPANYSGGGLTFRLWWTGDASDTQPVVWQTLIERMTSGENWAGTNVFSSLVSPNPAGPATAGIGQYTDFARSSAQLDGAVAGDWIRILLARQSNNSSDDYTGNAWVLGIQLFEP